MINDFISKIIISFDGFLTSLGLYTKITELIGFLDDFQSYSTEFNKYLTGVYFILGKGLCTYIISVFVVVVVVRILFAVVHLVGQFVP